MVVKRTMSVSSVQMSKPATGCKSIEAKGIDEAVVRSRLLNDFNLEIGAGLGALAGKVWRIGLMGHSSRAENIFLCISALEAVMSDMGADINTGVALSAAQNAMK